MYKQKFIKSLIGLIIVGAIITLSYFQFIKNSLKEKNLISKPALTLPSMPQGWRITEQNQENLLYKIEKESDSAVTPVIAMIKSNLPKEIDPNKYIHSLKSGAKSTIPSLVFTSDKELDQDSRQRQLEGYYYIGETKIGFVQRLLVKNDFLYTINASFIDTDLSQDIEEIISKLIETPT